MEIHPYVRTLMERFATSDAELERWIRHHEATTLEDVAEANARIELEDYLDVVGWDDGVRQGRR